MEAIAFNTAATVWWMWSDGTLFDPKTKQDSTVEKETENGMARVAHIIKREQLGDELPYSYLVIIEYNL